MLDNCDHTEETNYELAFIRGVLDGHTDCIKILLRKGANVNTTDGTGNTALIHSARIGNEDCLEIVLNAGADVNKTDKYV